MKTLLQLANAVATEIQLPIPSSVSGLTDPTPRRMIRYANKAVDFVGRSADWSLLRKEHVFTASNVSEQANAIPSDFMRMVPGTFWDRTHGFAFKGPLHPYQWQRIASNSPNQSSPVFTMRGNAIHVYPEPDGNESLAFEYISNGFVETAGGVIQSSFQVDTDMNRLDDELVILAMIMDWLGAEAQPFEIPMALYRQRLVALASHDNPTDGLLKPDVSWPAYGNFDIMVGGSY